MSLTRRVFLERVAQIGGYSAAFRTMQALGLMPLPGVSALPQLAADFGRGMSVIILGAGIAGLVSAYELCKAGFTRTILEARSRPGGRNWTVRDGSKVEFTDGTIQNCSWSDGGYLNAGPARIPSIHTHLLDYCQALSVPLEVNVSRSALMQSPLFNSGKPVEQRQVIHDTRGYLAELLSKCLQADALDDALSKEDTALLKDFLADFGDLDDNGKYVGSMRAGFVTPRGAGPAQHLLHKPLKLHDLLVADLSKGEFYEDEIDWQATMFQPVGGMDRIPYAFARALNASIIHFDSPVKEITTGDDKVTVTYSKVGTPQTLTADFCPGKYQKQLLSGDQPGVYRHARLRPVQDRLGVASLLGEGEPYLRRHLFPQKYRRPGLVSQRKAFFSYRRPGRQASTRSAMTWAAWERTSAIAQGNPLHSALCPPSKPSWTPRGRRSKHFTPVAPDCWRNPSTSAGPGFPTR